MKTFAWKITNARDEPRIDIADDIGPGAYTAQNFRRELKAIKAPRLLVVIDSAGGSLTDGFNIYSALRDFDGQVITHARMALSAASLIFVAGAKREVAPRGQILLHLPRASDVTGTTDEIASFSKSMNSLTTALAGAYFEATGQGTVDSWLDVMRRETLFTAEEAVAAGLAHVIKDRRAEEAIAAKAKPLPVLGAVLVGIYEAQIEHAVRQGIATGVAQLMVSACGAPPPPRPRKWQHAGGGDFR